MSLGGEELVLVRWQGGERFEGGVPGRAPTLVDGEGQAATNPVDLLLVAAATCSGVDVVAILSKLRVALHTLVIAVRGTRREAPPRRYTAIHFTFTVTGTGADEVKTRRAVELSVMKYCSVIASLASDIAVTYDVVVR